MKLFGLIGYPLSHSFSREYFLNKFQKEVITGYDYRLFELKDIVDLPDLIKANRNLVGFNVTIPHKQTIIKFLDELDENADLIGAASCVKIEWVGDKFVTKGYNTDVYGFETSLRPLLKPWHRKALILGTGGSSKAVSFVLEKLGIEFIYASRNPIGSNQLGYNQISKQIIEDHTLIINTTPVGMFPQIDNTPDIPYEFFTQQHLLYDLIYNPIETIFLKKGREKGVQTKNGIEMLHLQAEKSWEIWKGQN